MQSTYSLWGISSSCIVHWHTNNIILNDNRHNFAMIELLLFNRLFEENSFHVLIITIRTRIEAKIREYRWWLNCHTRWTLVQQNDRDRDSRIYRDGDGDDDDDANDGDAYTFKNLIIRTRTIFLRRRILMTKISRNYRAPNGHLLYARKSASIVFLDRDSDSARRIELTFSPEIYSRQIVIATLLHFRAWSAYSPLRLPHATILYRYYTFTLLEYRSISTR